MAYIALYRKYRARGFDEVLGQKHVTQTLQNALRSGKFTHAYLFCGPRGCGKTSTARLLAKSLNCLRDNRPTPEPCDECSMCERIREGSLIDVREMDAASETGIDDVKVLIENAKYPPMEARYKVYIIDEVHDLSAKAFDALLKTIEEPPPHVVFVLATTEAHKVPPTIRSRCQLYQFHRGSIADLVERLEFVVNSEGLKAEPAALAAIARMGDGSWRDSLTLLEQVIAFGKETLSLETVSDALGLVEEDTLNSMLESLASGDAAGLLQGVESEMKRGREARSIMESLIGKLRELVFASYNVEADEWLDPHRRGVLHEQAVRLGRARLQKWWSRLSEAAGQLRNVGSPRQWLEVTLLAMAEEALLPAQPVAVTAAAVPATAAVSEPAALESSDASDTPPAPRFAKPPAVTPSEESKLSTPVPSSNGNGNSLSVPKLEPLIESPKQEAEPAAPAIPTNGRTHSDYTRAWGQAVENMIQKWPTARQFVAGSRLVEVKDKLATINFPSELAFTKIQEKARLKAAQDELSSVLGEPGWRINPQLVLEDAPDEEAENDAPVSVSMPIEGEALVQAVKDIFDGEVLAGEKKKTRRSDKFDRSEGD